MVKGFNNFLGWGLFFTGAAKLIYVVVVYMKMMTLISSMFSGNVTDINYYPMISGIIALAQLLFAILSIVMIFVNINKCSGVIKGYLVGLGALAMEFILPSFILFYLAVVECSLYMKAGSIIRKENENMALNSKDMDWFYNR